MLIPSRAVSQFTLALRDGYGYAGTPDNVWTLYSPCKALYYLGVPCLVSTAPGTTPFQIIIRRLRIGHVWQLREIDALAQGFVSWRDMINTWAWVHDSAWWQWCDQRAILHILPLMLAARGSRWRCAVVDFERTYYRS